MGTNKETDDYIGDSPGPPLLSSLPPSLPPYQRSYLQLPSPLRRPLDPLDIRLQSSLLPSLPPSLLPAPGEEGSEIVGVLSHVLGRGSSHLEVVERGMAVAGELGRVVGEEGRKGGDRRE